MEYSFYVGDQFTVTCSDGSEEVVTIRAIMDDDIVIEYTDGDRQVLTAGHLSKLNPQYKCNLCGRNHPCADGYHNG